MTTTNEIYSKPYWTKNADNYKTKQKYRQAEKDLLTQSSDHEAEGMLTRPCIAPKLRLQDKNPITQPS